MFQEIQGSLYIVMDYAELDLRSWFQDQLSKQPEELLANIKHAFAEMVKVGLTCKLF